MPGNENKKQQTKGDNRNQDKNNKKDTMNSEKIRYEHADDIYK
ncbi:hypothetical protein [Mesobacillus foraminis]|uniref:Uncharacterized protein n=1 Tax=Mesobacillus foraminis TaxID=279826 RepID=A0A4R2B210_9BACI|nr:hypothetical protein [Mesobacillus foraminis]TCN20517.1 hypothetical protein EV146_114137 [Mesobacillus foraminis]